MAKKKKGTEVKAEVKTELKQSDSREYTRAVRDHGREVVLMLIGELTLLENPRTHPEREIQAIMQAIETYGFLDPVFISGPENNLISGYARVEAAKRLGWTSIPTLRLDLLSPTEYRAVMILCNRLPEMASWDYQLMIGLIEKELQENVLTLESVGFSDEEFANIKGWQDDVAKGVANVGDFLADTPAPVVGDGVQPEPAEVVEIVITVPKVSFETSRLEIDTELAMLATKFQGMRFSAPKVKKPRA